MRICLPINPTPPIIGYVRHAYRLAILTTNPVHLPWIQCHYLALTSGQLHRDPTRVEDFNFQFSPLYNYRPPGLEIGGVHRDLVLGRRGSITPFIQESLSLGYYLHLFVDEYHLPHKRAFGSDHFSHQTLVFGYDPVERVVLTLGFDQAQNFAVTPVPAIAFEKAFASCEFERWKPVHQIDLFRRKDEGAYVFDPAWVRNQLKDYLKGRNPLARHPSEENLRNARYGIRSVEGLAAHLEYCVRTQTFDVRPLHVLWEHKSRMVQRMHYMEAHGFCESEAGLTDAYTEIERDAARFRMMAMKYSVTGDTIILARIIEKLETIWSRERYLLSAFSDTIRTDPMSPAVRVGQSRTDYEELSSDPA